jgi:pilus assembly protein CpaC
LAEKSTVVAEASPNQVQPLPPAPTAAGAVPSGNETSAAPSGKGKVAAATDASQVPSSPPAAGTIQSGDQTSATRLKKRKAATGASEVQSSPPANDGTAQSGDEEVIIPLGEFKVLPISGKITRIAVGNGKIINTTTLENRLLLIAEQVGTTRIMVWSAQGTRAFRIQVAHPQLASARSLLQEVVSRNSGLQMKEEDSRLVVTGIAQKSVIAQLQKFAADIPSILINVVPDQGTAATQSVLFRLHFIEVKKSFLKNIGIKWGADMSGPVFGAQAAKGTGIYRNIPPATDGANLLQDSRPFYSVNGRSSGIFLGLASSLASRINLGVSDGDMRVLASPELTAKSGGQAKLQVGGEVPIPMSGAFGSTSVEFKPYGVLFSIEPTVDVNGTITAKISTELSQIDPSVTVQGIPGFLTRSTSAEVSVRDGDVFALSGLLWGELSNSIDKVPGLGSIPILGRLFSSDNYRNQLTDLVVLVETELINGGSGIANQVLQRGQRNIQEFKDISQQQEPVTIGRRPLDPPTKLGPPAEQPLHGGN